MALDFEAVLRRLMSEPEWFTVTSVHVSSAPAFGSYVIRLEGPSIADDLNDMRRAGRVGDIELLSGVVHPPGRGWVYAFRVDASGLQIAANASSEALEVIRPRLVEAAS